MSAFVIGMLVSTPCVSPPTVSLLEGGLGEAVSACQGTRVGARIGGSLLADTDHFYGNIRGHLNVDGRFELGDRWAALASVELVRYQQVLSSLSASNLGFGFLRLGVAWSPQGAEDGLAAAFRVVAPTATGVFESAWPVSADLSLDVRRSWKESVGAHGRISLLGTAMIGEEAHPRGGLLVGAGVEVRPTSWLSTSFDAEALMGYFDEVDHIGFLVSGNFELTSNDSIRLDLSFPVLGEERTLTAISVGFVHAFEAGP